MNTADVDAIFSGKPLTRFSAHTPTTIAELHLTLKRVRQEGIAWSDGFFEPSISSAAVAVLDFAGTPVAALNVSGPVDAFRDKARRKLVEQELRAAGLEISQRLGWVEPSGGRVEPGRSKPPKRVRRAVG
jgi:DNA-binding IclR family transcriptional regulator